MVGHKVKIQSQQTPFFFGDSIWGYDMSCGWKQGLGWGEQLSEKGSVKQTMQFAAMYRYIVIEGEPVIKENLGPKYL